MTTSFLVDTDVFGAGLTTAAARWRAVAAARADATAVRTPEASLTFAETAAQADRRAQQIVGMTEAGRPIAISIESDTDTVVSMLAVLCSGRPLVLLDPFLPADRRERVLRLSGAHLWEPLDADVDPGGTVSGAPEPAPDDPAVLLFTSGSTGTPTGAVLLPLSFGGGLDALAMSLLNGATVLLWDVRRRTTSGLRDWLASERATTVHSTPSLLRSWLGELTADDAVDSVRLLSTCGEPTHHTDVLLTRETLMPHGMFCSGAGASEVGNLAFNLLSPEQEIEAGPVPVGLPASDKHIRIVDEDGADLPAGTTGEVLVESAHIASGYHDDPEQTANRFEELADGRTRYRTGDLGRLDESGGLHLLGRLDDAVKIRGYLVEPIEVEAALRALPWTLDAVVTADPDAGRLTAHVAVDPQKWSPTSAEIRRALGESLASWMIPRDIVVLSELPRNERGKVDRGALPPPPPRHVPEPPRGLTEMALHQFWCDILGLESIGRNEDFVELGGDSLAAAKMLAEVHHHLQLEVTTAMLAEAPTIALFAQRIESAAKERSAKATGATLVPLRPGTGTPIFLIAGAGSLATSLTPMVRAISTDRPIYAIQARGVETRGRADHSIRAAARRAIADIRSVQPHGPYQIGGYSLGGFIAVEAAARLTTAGETCGIVTVIDSAFVPALARRLRGERVGVLSRARAALRSLTAEDDTLPDRTGDAAAKPAAPLPQRIVQQVGLHALMLTAGLVPLPTALQWVVFFSLGTRMIGRHRPSPFTGPIAVIRSRTNSDDPDLWGHLTSGEVEFADVSGDHISMIRAPYATETARALEAVLARTDGPA